MNGNKAAVKRAANAIVLGLNKEGYFPSVRECMDGVGINVRFTNGYGADIVCHSGSYGGKRGLWELAVFRGKKIVYDTPITNDVLGWLNEREVLQAVKDIEALPGA